VARGIHDKLVRRHPHVFGGASSDPADINRRWEEIKQAERGERGAVGPMDGIPSALPSVLYAVKVLNRAAAAGHQWTPGAPASPNDVDDLGERLLALVAEALEADADPEAALRHAAARVIDTVD
jgi:XTP/dITP diphosphohydrolase